MEFLNALRGPVPAGLKIGDPFYVLYMEDCQAPGTSRVDIDKGFVQDLGARLQDEGHPLVCIDREYIVTLPETVILDLARPETRWLGMLNQYTFITELRKTYKGLITLYGGGTHAGWMDFCGWFIQQGWSSWVRQKWAYFDSWERDIKPLIETLDFVSPSVYGGYHFYQPENPDYGLQYRLEFEDYCKAMAHSYQMIDAAMKLYHDKPVVWFVRPHWEHGAPKGALSSQLKALEQYGWPVALWASEDAVIPEYEQGVINAFSDAA